MLKYNCPNFVQLAAEHGSIGSRAGNPLRQDNDSEYRHTLFTDK